MEYKEKFTKLENPRIFYLKRNGIEKYFVAFGRSDSGEYSGCFISPTDISHLSLDELTEKVKIGKISWKKLDELD